ncbi:MAG TPA: S8 family serine peptidase [Polyangiaceae bacterium]|nr:S8 family serine peptidase [Polyangiaceae bacterium]
MTMVSWSFRGSLTALALGALMASGCHAPGGDGGPGGGGPRGGGPGAGPSSGLGTLGAALSFASPHDVAGVNYRVLPADQPCDAPPLAETTAPLESEPAPGSVQPPGAGGGHRFADAFFTLAPGSYRLCVAPVQSGGAPSAACAPASAVADVLEGATTEVVLVSQCQGQGNGGLDGVTVLNDPPRLDALTLAPSKFLQSCELATLTAGASDANGDALTYAWSIASGPPGAQLAGGGPQATFSSPVVGDFQLKVVVTDVYGASTSLTFPLYVSGPPCDDGNACNGVEACGGPGQCVAGPPPALDDGNACTADLCDPATGGVSHEILPDGTTCEGCGSNGTCQSGVCTCATGLALDTSPAAVTIVQGQSQNLLTLLNLTHAAGGLVNVVAQTSVAPDTGGLAITSDYPPGGYLADASTTFVLNQSVSGLSVGSYQLAVQAAIAGTAVTATSLVAVNVVPAAGDPLILPPGTDPDGVVIGAPTEVAFTARVVDFVTPPAELSLRRVDGAGDPVIATLRDDGLGADLEADDGVYTGQATVTALGEAPLLFRATGSFPGLPGERSSDTISLAATCFPTTLRPPVAGTVVTDPVTGSPIVCNEILVTFAPGASCAAIGAAAGLAGGAVVGSIPGLGIYQVGLGGPCTGAHVRNAIGAVAGAPFVVAAGPNFAGITGSEVTPNDPEYASQHGPKLIRADEAWVIARGHRTIAVLDSGVDYNHEDLAGKVIKGRDFVNGDDDPMDDHNHGTRVASVAAATSDNAKGIAGVAWHSRILAIKMLDDSKNGTLANAIAAVKNAADRGASIINCSWSVLESALSEDDLDLLEEAVKYAASKGALVVAASGNDGDDARHVPCAYADALCVGATDTTGAARAGFSSYGPHVDLAAPGEAIRVADLGGGYANDSGTSFAAPHVSGALAVVRARFPAWGAARLRERLANTAKPLEGQELGAGLLDLFDAVFNGSFEDQLEGWAADGTVGSVTSLGSLAPRDRARMGLVSSGPDAAQVQTTLQQSLTIQPGVTSIALKFDYNFVTEEYPEWVGTAFNDNLRIVLVAPNGAETTLALETVNGSTFTPIGGIDFPGGDDTVGHTGWKTASTTVPVTEGSGTYLIRIRDEGDGIFDSNALIDHIRFK